MAERKDKLDDDEVNKILKDKKDKVKKLHKEGKSLREIMIETRMPAALVRRSIGGDD